MNKEMVAMEMLKLADTILATDFPTQEALDKYLKEHPDADRSNHKVVKDKGTSMEDHPYNQMQKRKNEEAMKEIGKHFKKDPKDLTVDEIMEYNQGKGKKATDFPTQEALDKYLDEHPSANPAVHHVKKTEGDKLREKVYDIHHASVIASEMVKLAEAILADEKTETFKCPKCGTSVLKNTGYCLKCKEKVKEASVKTAAAGPYTLLLQLQDDIRRGRLNDEHYLQTVGYGWGHTKGVDYLFGDAATEIAYGLIGYAAGRKSQEEILAIIKRNLPQALIDNKAFEGLRGEQIETHNLWMKMVKEAR
jgi:predicted RNA-binding Zn-ribbon protein involved in translation (DUF1610 family)